MRMLASAIAIAAAAWAAPAAAQYYGGGYGNTIRCESNDGRTRECAMDTRGGVQLVRQISKAACIEGRSWGIGRNGVWVSQGCRGEFQSSPGGYYGGNSGYYGGTGQVFRCESNDGRMRQCSVDTRGGVTLVRQISKAACVEGRTWGFGNGGIWVNDGCRGEFATGRRGSYGYGNYGNQGYGGGYYGNQGYGQTFRCESNNGQYQRCNIGNARSVQLVRQHSSAACIEGRTWGRDAGGVWVNQGCRADFRTY